MEYSVHEIPPAFFKESVSVAGCFIEHQGKLLLLKRSQQRPQGGTWNIPAGKMEAWETPEQAAIREVREETGIELEAPLAFLKTLYISIPECDYAFHMFHARFDHEPMVMLDGEEQVAHQWLTVEQAQTLPLIAGGKEALRIMNERRSRS